MAAEAAFVRHGDAPQHEGAPVHQWVEIEAEAAPR
jgi:hypothetical protein